VSVDASDRSEDSNPRSPNRRDDADATDAVGSGVAGVAGLAGCVGAPDAADGQRDAGDGSDGTEATGESGEPTENDDDAEDDATRIGFVGDLMLGRSVNERWADDDNPENVWGSTLSASRTRRTGRKLGVLRLRSRDAGRTRGTTFGLIPPSPCRLWRRRAPRSSRSREQPRPRLPRTRTPGYRIPSDRGGDRERRRRH